MSASHITPAALQAIFSSLKSGRIEISTGYAACALIVYDYFLTVSQEATEMWRPKRKTLVFYLFTTLRYATILYQLTFSMSFFLPFSSNRGCASIIYVEQVCFIFSSAALSASGVFALRTFAIYQRNWYILAVLLFIATVKVFISAVDFFVSAKIVTQSPSFRQFGSCSETLAGNTAKWNTASAGMALGFDTIVLGLTLAKTVRTSLRRKELGLRKSYSYYIIRDGLLYYFTIEILLLLTVIFNQAVQVPVAKVVIILQTSVAPALAQRLVLNLRTVDEKVLKGDDSERSQPLPPIDFAHGSVIGNIGAPLRVDEDDYEDSILGLGDSDATAEADGLDGIQMVMIADEAEKGSPGGDANATIGYVL
ncbi:hypothetical protein BDZ97DRAFT_1762345 [Flammula alnicola]|nr:hypothetical protein BDZ97DRAFT_1762345 [Flammula alnicola]